MGINGKAFVCSRGELQIRGMEFLPENAVQGKRYPAIIFSHGFTCNYTNMIRFCEAFAIQGYVTICFSFCGGSNIHDHGESLSDGETTQMSLRTEIEDLSTVLNYVKELPYVDASEIILAGESQGGCVSGLTAAKHPEEISKLIMIYPALCIPDHARLGRLGGACYDPANPPETIDCGNSILSRNYHREACNMDPYQELLPFKGEVLILHGLEDPIVNYSYSIKAKEAYEKGQCHLQLVRSMGHELEAWKFDSAVASIRQFLNGRKELFAIRILITNTEEHMEGAVLKKNLYFGGFCESELFCGTILSGGVDRQEYIEGRQTKLCAEYTLDGLDKAGKHCQLRIVNQRGEIDFVPTITTDSEALAFLNGADLTAVLEYGEGGPTVRIFL